MLRGRLLAAPLSGLVLGALDSGVALATGRAAPRLVALAVAIGAVMAVSLLVAAPAIALVSVAARRWPESALATWLGQRFSRDAPRPPVIAAHAVLVATAAVACVALVVLDRVLERLDSIESPPLQRSLALVAMLGVSLASAIAVGLLARALRPALERVDRRIGLPWPADASVRRVFWFGLPLLLMSGLPLVLWADRLGALVWLLALGMLCALTAACVELIAQAPVPRAFVITTWTTASAWIAVTAACGFFLQHSALPSSPLAERSLAVLQALTDVDGDGDSGLFGGRDCRPLDANVYSMANDLPGNRIDEDCDGKDARESSGFPRPAQPFSRSSRGLGFKPHHFNIVWFIAEAIRADHTSLFGYKKRTTPYLEKLAKEALVFSRAYSQGSATMLSFPSMLSGSDPATMRWTKLQDKLQADVSHVFLAQRLAQLGYRTLMTTSGYFKANLSTLHRGFQKTESFWIDGKRSPWNERPAAASTAMAIRLLENDPAFPRQHKPFFLLAYLPDAHAPYDAHDEAFPRFGKDSVGLYDGEVAFADRYAGFLLDYLRHNLPSWEDTIVVFNADHGEEFGEHGETNHGYTCNRQGVHVPLIVKIPGMKPAIVDQPVALVDIVPTLLEAIGEDPGEMKLDGQSLLVPALSKQPPDPKRPIFCATLLQDDNHGNFFIRGVRTGSRAYVRDEISGRSALYDITGDFAEAHDLSKQANEAQTAAELDRLLKRSLTGNLWQSRLSQ